MSDALAVAPASFDLAKPICIDVYRYDNIVDLKLTKAAGIDYCFLKCTEGTAYQDPTYHARRQMALGAGMRVGAYHFAHLSGDPMAEADFFLDWADVQEWLALALDWERLRDGSYGKQDRAAAFVQRVLDRTKRKRIWIYGGDVLKEGIPVAAKPFWSEMYLWLCQYGHAFTAPIAWSRLPDLWQNNGDSWGPGPHRLPGINGLIDNSRIVVGTPADLGVKWANAT